MTFWYINEYVPTTSASGWRLRIGAFNLAGGGSPTPTPTASPSSTPTPTPTPTATPGGCIVVNGDFETGSLPPWINTGDTSFTAVNDVNPHTGTFSLQTGPTNDDGFIDQVLPTVAGSSV